MAHPVHVVLMNFTNEFSRNLIDNGYTFAGLLPVSISNTCIKEEEGIRKRGIDFAPVLNVFGTMSSSEHYQEWRGIETTSLT